MHQVDTTLSFGYWLRRQRQARDLTQAVLARRVGCATVTIQKIERDERRPSRQMAEHLAEVLGVEATARAEFVAAALGERSVRHLRLADRPLEPAQPRFTLNLPTTYTPFFGREIELAQIATRLADPACRLLTIVGPGGIGKTRLAIAATLHNAARFADGACYVGLTAVTQGALLADEILRALDTPSPVHAWVQLVETLRDRELLLVLDNFEQLVESAGLLAGLLDAAPKLKLLVTSRSRLNLGAEWLIPLAGLAVPDGAPEGIAGLSAAQALPVAEAESYGAVQLFVHGMRRLRPDVALTPADAATIVRICRLVDGNPLAIELAAGWTRTLSPAAVLAEVGRGLDLLATTQRDAPERHRSIRAVFDHTWTLLTEREQGLLRQLSVFRGGFTPAAAAAVAGATTTELAALVDKSWLRIRPNGRGEMHELVRQYCEERLEREHAALSGESAAAVRERFSVHFTGFIREQMSRVNFSSEVAGEVATELGNLQVVWDWVIQHGTLQAGTDLVVAIYAMGDMLGWLQPVLQLFDTIRPRLAAQLGPAVDPERRAVAGGTLSWLENMRWYICRRLGLLVEAQGTLIRLQGVIDAGVAAPDVEQMVLGVRGVQALYHGRWAESRQWHTRMLDALATRPAAAYLVFGNERGPGFWAAICHLRMAWCAALEGDYPAAHDHHRRGMALREEIGEMRYRGEHWALLAILENLEGDPAGALSLAQQATQHCESFGDQLGLGLAQLALGQVQAALGQVDGARVSLNDALAVGRQSGELRLILEPLVELGRLELAQGNIAAAKAHFEAGLAAFAKLNEAHSNFLVGVWLGLGWAALAEQEWETARQRFIQTATGHGAAAWEMLDAAAGLAEVYAAHGRMNEAVALLELVANAPPTAAFTRRRLAETGARLGLKLTGHARPDWRAALNAHLTTRASPPDR